MQWVSHGLAGKGLRLVFGLASQCGGTCSTPTHAGRVRCATPVTPLQLLIINGLRKPHPLHPVTLCYIQLSRPHPIGEMVDERVPVLCTTKVMDHAIPTRFLPQRNAARPAATKGIEPQMNTDQRGCGSILAKMSDSDGLQCKELKEKSLCRSVFAILGFSCGHFIFGCGFAALDHRWFGFSFCQKNGVINIFLTASF